MCQRPLLVDGKFFGCHKCHECRLHDSNEWYVRIYHEILTHSSKVPAFVALTYDPQHIPADGNGVPSDPLAFIARLRDRLGYPEDFKYFLTSEYGDKHGRIHYHIIFMNLPKDVLDFADRKLVRSFRKLVNKCWKAGRTSVDSVTSQRIRYVVDYISNDDKKNSEKFGNSPEFRRMSKFIGFDWIDNIDNQRFVETNDFVVINGYKYSVPAYYKRKIRERKSIVDKEISKIDSWIKVLNRLQDRNYFFVPIDLDQYRKFLIERNEPEWFCRDKEFETVIKKVKRRRNYYYRKIYGSRSDSISQPDQVCFMKVSELVSDKNDLLKFHDLDFELSNLLVAYDRHKSEYRSIYYRVVGDLTGRFDFLDERIAYFDCCIEDAINNYVNHVVYEAPQRLLNFKRKKDLKRLKNSKDSKLKYYYEYMNYEI